MSGDRKGQGPFWWLVFAAVMYLIASGGIAIATASDCGDFDATKEWVFFPPGWDCG